MTAEHRVYIEIAGMSAAIYTDSAEFAARLRRRYGPFLAPDDVVADITVEVSLVPGALYVEPQPGNWVIESHIGPEQLSYRSYQEVGEMDLRRRRARVEMAPDAHLENFLRVVFAWLCLEQGALLLHGAGVIRDSRGYVFFGPSGAGKTTLSRLASRQATVLSDDLVILRSSDEGVQLHGVPFKGELSEAPRANQNAPLRGIFRLQQARRHAVEPLPIATATAELVAAAPFVVREPALGAQLIAVCHRIATAVPVQTLFFRRDDGFWKAIDEKLTPVSETASTNSRPGY